MSTNLPSERGFGTAYRMHPARSQRPPAGTTALSDDAYGRIAGDALVRDGVRTGSVA